MTPALAIFGITLGFQKFDQLGRANCRKPTHAGIADQRFQFGSRVAASESARRAQSNSPKKVQLLRACFFLLRQPSRRWKNSRANRDNKPSNRLSGLLRVQSRFRKSAFSWLLIYCFSKIFSTRFTSSGASTPMLS